VRPFVILETAKSVEGMLLTRKAGLRRTTGFALECFVHALVSAVLLRVGGQDPLVLDAEPQPPDIETGEAVDAGGRKGTPLSVRMGLGSPYSRKSRSKTGWTPWPLVESRPWHARR
jgi:hypothetical protein